MVTEQDITQKDLIVKAADVLLAQGEGLLNDQGVDPHVAYALATDIVNQVIGDLTCGTCTKWDFDFEVNRCEMCKTSPATISTYCEADLCDYCVTEHRKGCVACNGSAKT